MADIISIGYREDSEPSLIWQLAEVDRDRLVMLINEGTPELAEDVIRSLLTIKQRAIIDCKTRQSRYVPDTSKLMWELYKYCQESFDGVITGQPFINLITLVAELGSRDTPGSLDRLYSRSNYIVKLQHWDMYVGKPWTATTLHSLPRLGVLAENIIMPNLF